MSETSDTGKKRRTYVIAGGGILARQGVEENNDESVGWIYTEASGYSTRTDVVGTGTSTDEVLVKEERDALGNSIGLKVPIGPVQQIPYSNSPNDGILFTDVNAGDCATATGFTVCLSDHEKQMLRSGAADIDSRWSSSLPGSGIFIFRFPGSNAESGDHTDRLEVFYSNWRSSTKAHNGVASVERDCNKEAGLSGDMAVPQQAADIMLNASIKENFPAEALAVTWRFEGTFYDMQGRFIESHAANPNYLKNIRTGAPLRDANGNLVPSSPIGRDYGAFQLNPNFVYKYQNNRSYPYKVSEYPLAFGELGSPTFNGSITQNARLAARFMMANGGSIDNQVMHFAPDRLRRLELWKAWGPAYKTFFDCWRSLR